MKKEKMRKVFFMIGFWIPMFTFSQVRDDFSDGDFASDPHWSGDSTHFEVNAARQLHLKSSGADTSFLSVQNSMVLKTEWEFWFKLSFNTSSNNYFRIYLASDHENLKGPLNGYYIRIGGTDDSLAFIRQSGLDRQTVFHGHRVCTNHSTNIIRLRILHNPDGRWDIFADDTGGTNYIEEGSFYDSIFTSTAWFGICCRYTASNSAKFYFDDLYIGPIRADTVPPAIEYAHAVGSKELELVFSENLDKEIAGQAGNYRTSQGNVPVRALPDPSDPRTVHLEFASDFLENITDTLIISGICDLWGNRADILKAAFTWFRLHPYDVVITEIMADPDPPAGLPVSEYVEIFNRTRFPVCLKNWEFGYGSSSRKFPDVSLEDGKYLILAHDPDLENYGKTVRMLTSATSLSNEGSVLVLKDSGGKVIHSVSYAKEWYRDKIKAEGGWSLEMIDPGNPCGCGENWIASKDPKGGTPGSINSVNAPNPDLEPPQIERLYSVNPGEVEVYFTEPMDSTGFTGPEQWELIGTGIPGSMKIIPPDYRKIILSSFPVQMSEGTVYRLACSGGPRDCAGNELKPVPEGHTGLPGDILPGDIVFNEVLPDPYPGGSRFIEICNRSEKLLDLKELAIGNPDTLSGAPLQPCALSGGGFLLFPGDYLALTRDPADIMSRYNTPGRRAFLQLTCFPRMNNDGETLVLARISDGKEIDRMAYSKSMHFPLFISSEGISLEKIHPSLSSGDPYSWHSASDLCRFATPGYRNSQYRDIWAETNESLSVPPVFSPDNDGIDDVLAIRVRTGNPGYAASLWVFDPQGRRICQPARNIHLGADDVIIWDGLMETGRKAPVGQYILLLELISPEGRSSHFKRVVTLAGRR